MVACENPHGKPGFVAMEAVGSVDGEMISDFAQRRLASLNKVRTDGFSAMKSRAQAHQHIACITPSELAKEWLPWVHIAIVNLRSFLLGTYHGISHRYLQEYLDEFVYRFNRRFWERNLVLELEGC